VTNEFERALSETGALLCVECGKCTAVCPMAEMYPGLCGELSPRALVQEALGGKDILSGRALWCCTLCRACTRTCPAGVDCCALVERLRPIAATTVGKFDRIGCAVCGADLPPPPVLEYLRSVLPADGTHYLDLCPACRRQAYIRNNS
jgi:Fe-S oxidoreductase